MGFVGRVMLCGRWKTSWLAVAWVWLTAGLLLAANPAPTVTKVPAPSWVEPVAVPLDEAIPEGAGGGTRLLLDEEQVKANESAFFVHRARQFLGKSGIDEGSRITVSVNPAFQSLAFHKLVVHRDGQVIDRLPEQEIRLLQREERMERNLFDGRLSAVLVLDDIRVGDVVEYAYTLRGANPIFGGKFMDWVDLQDDEPIVSLRYRLIWPKDRPLGIYNHATALAPKVKPRSGGGSEYLWERRDAPALLTEADLPDGFDPAPWVQLTEYRSWNEVARWASALYPTPPLAPAVLRPEIKRLSQFPTEEEQILGALAYVQDEIRYLGVEMGKNSHHPHTVESILQRRFGDCKDKALLLVTMLRNLGFEAYPALVDSSRGLRFDDLKPSPLVFDHVVVQLVYKDQIYWLDPTDRDQGGGLDDLYFPPYDKALVVRPESTALTPIGLAGHDALGTSVTESYDLQDFEGEATLRVRTVYTGRDADYMRSYLDDHDQKEIRKSYLDYYAREYPEIEAIDPPRFQDNLKRNILTCEETYYISGFWSESEDDPKRLAGEVVSQAVREELPAAGSPLRTMPLAVNFPCRVSNIIEINFPKKLKFDPEKTEVEDPAFRYSFSAEPSGAMLRLRYFYETRAEEVMASRAPDYFENIASVRRTLRYQVTIPESWGKVEAAAAAPTPGEEVTETPAATGTRSVGSVVGAITIGLGLLAAASAFLVLRVLRLHRVQDGGGSGATVVYPTPAEEETPFHRCAVCGRTDEKLDFRVAADGQEYCTEHLPRGR